MIAATRPNILVIISDQHAQRVTGCYGDPLGVTPALDALARRGTVFDNAYCPSPICAPSRAALMTGQHPFRQHCWTNSDMLASDLPTWAHLLGAAGYRTALIGRMHFIGPDQLHGFDERQVGDHSSNWPGAEGFDHGVLSGTAGPSVRSVALSGPGCNAYDLKDRDTAAAAADWLRTQGSAMPSGQPFLLAVGLMLPHPPYVCDPEDYEAVLPLVGPARLPPPDPVTEHPWLAEWRAGRDIKDLAPEDLIRARRAYWGLVRRMDILIGQILQALDDSGQADNTIVVYLSDHGDHLGERGLFWKHTFFEESVKVPLIVAGSPGGRPGQRRGDVVSLLDLLPTLTDLAGIETDIPLDGRSLFPMLRGEVVPEGEVFSEYCCDTADPWSTSTCIAQRMLRAGRYKYVHHWGFRPQLYDLADDPLEQHDLADDPAMATVRDRLAERVLAEWDPAAVIAELELRQRRTGVLKSWAVQTRPAEQYRWSMPPGSRTWVRTEP